MNNINDLEYRLWLLQGEVNQAMQNAGRADFTYLNRLNDMWVHSPPLGAQANFNRIEKRDTM